MFLFRLRGNSFLGSGGDREFLLGSGLLGWDRLGIEDIGNRRR